MNEWMNESLFLLSSDTFMNGKNEYMKNVVIRTKRLVVRITNKAYNQFKPGYASARCNCDILYTYQY